MAEMDNVVLKHLRHIRGALDDVRDDIREIKQRVGNLENQYANMSNRFDRMDVRIERIERRIDLTREIAASVGSAHPTFSASHILISD